MMAVLVILITAPIGAVGIALAGPRLLKQSQGSQQQDTPGDTLNAGKEELGDSNSLLEEK